ncbi:hypothetical protein [Streptomyces syringium]|uniref:hypothetical protein n=1 Tax=Streptomyces syringium TaxID=76729 RepID=UPI00341FCD90
MPTHPKFHFGRTWPYRFWNGPGLADRDLELGDDQEALQAAEQIREHGGCITWIEHRGDDGRWRTVWTVEPQYPWGKELRRMGPAGGSDLREALAVRPAPLRSWPIISLTRQQPACQGPR